MSQLILLQHTPSEMLAAAEQYISRGWALIPFAPNSKEPYYELLPLSEDGAGKTWRPLAMEPATIETVRSWLEQQPSINLGVICGQASGIAVIDADRPLTWPMRYATPTVKTGRGYHYYLQCEKPYKSAEIRTKRGKHAGELRAEGNITIIPPSTHATTKKPYEWVYSLGIDEIPLQPLNNELLEAIISLNPGIESISLIENRRAIMVGSTRGVKAFEAGRDEKAITDIPYIEYLRDPCVALSIMAAIGIDVQRIGQAFLCPIHEETKPSAALYLPHDQGFIAMHDFHTGEFVPLPDLYAAHITGKYKPLGRGERALWWLRCLVDLGYTDYPRVLARPLPEDAPKGAQELDEGFVKLLGVRKLYDPNQQETPFSWRFAGAWCGGLGTYSIAQGMEWLLKNKYIRKTGETRARTSLFTLAAAATGGSNE